MKVRTNSIRHKMKEENENVKKRKFQQNQHDITLLHCHAEEFNRHSFILHFSYVCSSQTTRFCRLRIKKILRKIDAVQQEKKLDGKSERIEIKWNRENWNEFISLVDVVSISARLWIELLISSPDHIIATMAQKRWKVESSWASSQ